jgi:hypothetical protein
MCGGSDVKCKVEVIELKNGYQVQITGDDVKDAFKHENLKKCIEACCSGEAPFNEFCCS